MFAGSLGGPSDTPANQPPTFENFKFNIIGRPPSLLGRISDVIPLAAADKDLIKENEVDVTMVDESNDNDALNNSLKAHGDGPSLLHRINLAVPRNSQFLDPASPSLFIPADLSMFPATESSSFGSISTLVASTSKTISLDLSLDHNDVDRISVSPVVESQPSPAILQRDFFSPSTINGNVRSEAFYRNLANSFFERAENLSPLYTLLLEEKNAWSDECEKRDREKNKFAEELQHWEQQWKQLKTNFSRTVTNKISTGNSSLFSTAPSATPPSPTRTILSISDSRQERPLITAPESNHEYLERIQPGTAELPISPTPSGVTQRAIQTSSLEVSSPINHQRFSLRSDGLAESPDLTNATSKPMTRDPSITDNPSQVQQTRTHLENELGATSSAKNATHYSQSDNNPELPERQIFSPSTVAPVVTAREIIPSHIAGSDGPTITTPSKQSSMADDRVASNVPSKRPRDNSTDTTVDESNAKQKQLRVDIPRESSGSATAPKPVSSRLDDTTASDLESHLHINVPLKRKARDSEKAEIDHTFNRQTSAQSASPFSDVPVKKIKEDSPVITFKEEFDDNDIPEDSPHTIDASHYPTAAQEDAVPPISASVFSTPATELSDTARSHSVLAQSQNDNSIPASGKDSTTENANPSLLSDQSQQIRRPVTQQEARFPVTSDTTLSRQAHLPVRPAKGHTTRPDFWTAQHWSPGVDDDGGPRIHIERTPSPLHHRTRLPYYRSTMDNERNPSYRGEAYTNSARPGNRLDANSYVPKKNPTNSSRPMSQYSSYVPSYGDRRSLSPPPPRFPPPATRSLTDRNSRKFVPRRIPTPPPKGSERGNDSTRLSNLELSATARFEQTAPRDYGSTDASDRFRFRREERFTNHRDRERDYGQPYGRERSASPHRSNRTLPSPTQQQSNISSTRGPSHHSNERSNTDHDSNRVAPTLQDPATQPTVQYVGDSSEQANDTVPKSDMSVVGRPPYEPVASDQLQSEEDDDPSPSKRLMSMELLYPPSEKGDADELSMSTMQTDHTRPAFDSGSAEHYPHPPQMETPPAIQGREPPALLGRFSTSEAQAMKTHKPVIAELTGSQERITNPHRYPSRGPTATSTAARNIPSGKELLSRIDMDVDEKQSPHQMSYRNYQEGTRSRLQATQEPHAHPHRRRVPSAKASLPPNAEQVQEPTFNSGFSLSKRIQLNKSPALHERISK